MGNIWEFVYCTIFFPLSYYTASPAGSPHYRHLYRLRDDDSGGDPSNSVPECITCLLSFVRNETESEVSLLLRRFHLQHKPDTPLPLVEAEGGCLYNEAHFSRDLSHFAVQCRGPEVPRTVLFRGGEGGDYEEEEAQYLGVLEDNARLRTDVVNMTLPKVSEIFFSSV